MFGYKKIIEDWAIENALNLDDYQYTKSIYPYSKWANSIILGSGDFIMIYDFTIVGTIASLSDLRDKNLLQIMSPNSTVNYKELIKATDIAGSIQLNSDYVSFHYNKIELQQLGTGNMFTDIFSGYLAYLYFKKIKN